MSAPDYSFGLEDLAGLISFRVGAWHDFGYEVPPSPECKAIPPLGERSAEAIKAGHEAIKAIDELTRQLHSLRDQLITELRRDEDINMARAGELLARLRAEREAADADEHQGADVDEELQPVVCLRAISTGKGLRACLLPVDHEPTSECPGNPHARPAAGEAAEHGYVTPAMAERRDKAAAEYADRHADLDPGELGGMSDAEFCDRTAEDGAS